MPHKPMSEESKQKWKDTFAEYSRTLKTYTTMSALHTLAQYWVENEFIIEQAAKNEVDLNGPKWRPARDDQDEISEYIMEQDLARYLHDNTLIPIHRYSSIVMLCTTVEREVVRLTENLQKELGPQKLNWQDINNNSTTGKIIKFCEAFFSLRLVDCAQYVAVTELQKVRNCIVHNHGDVSLSDSEGKKTFLLNLGKKRRGFCVDSLNTIVIDEECIKQFIDEIWAFFVSVFNTLKWDIASDWQGDKLEKAFKKLKT